jgi:hypothetical protein
VYLFTIAVYALWYGISVFVGLVLALGPFFSAIIGAAVLRWCCHDRHPGKLKTFSKVLQVLLLLLSLVGFSLPFIGFIVISTLACCIMSGLLCFLVRTAVTCKPCTSGSGSSNAAWHGDGANITVLTLFQFGSCQLLVFGVISAITVYSTYTGDTSPEALGQIFEAASDFTVRTYDYVYAAFKPPYPEPVFAMIPTMLDFLGEIDKIVEFDWWGDPFEMLETTNQICSLNLLVSILRGITSLCNFVMFSASCTEKPIAVGKDIISASGDDTSGVKTKVPASR